jgi:hypothetical protein
LYWSRVPEGEIGETVDVSMPFAISIVGGEGMDVGDGEDELWSVYVFALANWAGVEA